MQGESAGSVLSLRSFSILLSPPQSTALPALLCVPRQVMALADKSAWRAYGRSVTQVISRNAGSACAGVHRCVLKSLPDLRREDAGGLAQSGQVNYSG